jgi:hypothetical protein
MRSGAWLVIVVGTWGVPSTVRAADRTPAAHVRAVLDGALALSGLLSTHLPVVLTSVLPKAVAPGADAWTVYDEQGHGDRIFVYTGGRTFQCASTSRDGKYQCLLRLASIIVHEAWHLHHGSDEASAYGAQLAFLEFNGGSGLDILDIRQSRSRVLAEQRHAGQRAGWGAGVTTSERAATHSPQ